VNQFEISITTSGLPDIYIPQVDVFTYVFSIFSLIVFCSCCCVIQYLFFILVYFVKKIFFGKKKNVYLKIDDVSLNESFDYKNLN
jgi:hypothetical protein